VIPGELYVWPDCYQISKETREPTLWHAMFFYESDGNLWPRPIVGVNCSKMPEGEGTLCEVVRARYKQARES